MEKYRLLFESVTARKSAGESELDFLEKIAAEHPYFSPVQFYLLQLLPQDTDFYRTQAKKTSALFNNNYWLNFQLQESAAELTGMVTPQVGQVEEAAIITPGNENSIPASADMNENIPASPGSNDMAAETTTVEQLGGSPNNEGIDTVDEVEAAMLPSEELTSATDTISTMHESDLEPAETVEEAPVTEKVPAPVFEPGAGIPDTEPQTTDQLPKATSDEHTEAYAPEEPAAEMAESTADTGIENIETTTSVITEDENSDSLPAAGETSQQVIAGLLKVKKAEEAATPTEDPNRDEPESPGMSIPLPTVSAETNGTEMLFEPLHTSDYFASVGIRLSEEEKSGDRLGKQLKSFTDWLKTMKKVHASQLVQVTQTAEVEAAGAESKIQKLAERSNQDNEVLTEAMADVLLQQGRQEKATEILQKLSLLNPTKSAYFAAKINQIKEK